MREAFIAEKPRPLGAQLQHFDGKRAIVGRTAGFAARDPGAPGFFAQIAPRRDCEKRLDAGAAERDHIFAGKAALARGLGRLGDEPIGQAGEIVARLEHQREGLFIGEHVLRELRAERGEPLADLGEPRFDLRRKARAGAAEGEMMAFQDAALFGVEAKRIALLIDGIDAREERIVQMDLGVMPGEERRDLALDRLDRVIRMRMREIEEDGRDTAERAPRTLQRGDRIFEIGRRGIFRDGRNLGPMFGEGRRKRRTIMIGRDAVERRNAKRRGPVGQKRILPGMI